MASPYFYAYAIFTVFITFYLVITLLVGLLGKDFNFDSQETKREPVDIYLPICGEDIEIIENTFKHVSAMRKPDGSKVYVLDDGKPWGVASVIAYKYGFTYMCRRTNEGKKAGNLRYAFSVTSSPYIAIFDADFCPSEDFLDYTLSYFKDDVGIVQTPQYFAISDHQNWVGKGASFIQELFYRLIQTNRQTFDGAICVGSNAVYRRKALDSIGGFYQMNYSEDVHTGWAITDKGWKIKYIPINLAKGLCPDTMSQFFIQQYRWCMGSFSLFLNPKFWSSHLTIMQKVCYLTGMSYYIATAIGIFLTPLPIILLLILAPDKVHWYNLLFSVPSLLFSILFIAYWSKAKWGVYALTSRLVSYYAHFYAIIDRLRGSVMPWIPAGVRSKVDRYNSFKMLMFYWSALSFLAIFGLSCYRFPQVGANVIPSVLLAVFNVWLPLKIIREEV